MNVYVGMSISGHTVYCGCGLEGWFSSHSVNTITGNCRYCGFPILIPDDPIIPPIIIKPIV